MDFANGVVMSMLNAGQAPVFIHGDVLEMADCDVMQFPPVGSRRSVGTRR